ncbi:MAG: protein kinase [Bryobacteraceae bacterium]
MRKLGRSMTDVYLALDTEENRRVVLKIVEYSPDPYTQLVMDAERRGAAIQSQLQSLDSRIVQIYEYGEQNECFYVAMEYVEGTNLTEILRSEQRLSPKRAARYAMEICNQLQTLHSFKADIDGKDRAVVHGDVKPCNIQIGLNDEVRLLDFGIAKVITSTRNLTHHNLGSPAYCSPERVKSTNVNPHVDLWALGVTLYEMVSGMPPYQAQSTRKLENLIQSRRPPRALPEDCPPPLKAIIGNALAASIEHRYATAAAFESDLHSFLNNQPTLAEAQLEPAWESNETIERAQPPTVASVLEKRKVLLHLAEATRIAWILLAGFVFGLVLFIPAVYILRLSEMGASLRSPRDAVHSDLAGIETDWSRYQTLKRHGSFLGHFSPSEPAREALHANLVSYANHVIEQHRNSSDPRVDAFDWNKARASLRHALELDPSDQESKGKLALCDGFAELSANPTAARSSFEQAVQYIPRSPDSHLGLARLNVYSFHNMGRAMAEFQEAERLGFRPGPREMEQQADGYLYRAEQELKLSNGPKAERAHYLSLAQHDMERARHLYEPIDGFSKVGLSLKQLYSDERKHQQLHAVAAKPKPRPKARYARNRTWR